MAGVNQVFSLADDVARYVKACGKRSVLQTKPIQGKINPQELGARLPDGSISFSTQEEAIKYGIERCRQALLGPKPFERAVNIKGRRVVTEIQGIGDTVRMQNYSELMIHGHPDTYAKGCTTDISSGDYSSFIQKNCIKEFYAVNSKGEYYRLSKIPGFDYSKIDTRSIFGDFNECATRTFFGYDDAPIDQKECLERCFGTKNKNSYYDFWETYVKPLNNPRNITKKVVDQTHAFWVNFAERFGVKFDTNFSNFVNN